MRTSTTLLRPKTAKFGYYLFFGALVRISVVLVRISVVLVRISVVVLVPVTAGFSYCGAANCHPATTRAHANRSAAAGHPRPHQDPRPLHHHNRDSATTTTTDPPTTQHQLCGVACGFWLPTVPPPSPPDDRRAAPQHFRRDAGMPAGLEWWGPPDEGMQASRWTYWVVKVYAIFCRGKGARQGRWELYTEFWLRDLEFLEAKLRRVETGGLYVMRRVQLEQWSWTAEDGWQESTDQV